MVPKAAVLVIGDDDQHLAPLRTAAKPRQQVIDMRVAADEVGVRGMLGENSDRLVERNLRQCPGVDVAQEIFAILEMRGAIGRARRKASVVIERLVMRLEVGTAFTACVDDTALLLG